MKHLYFFILPITLVISLSFSLFSQSLWQEVEKGSAIIQSTGEKDIHPEEYKIFKLDEIGLETQLSEVPHESSRENDKPLISIQIPTPYGHSVEMQLIESPIMEEGLAIKFPEIKTYSGSSANGNITGRFDKTVHGLHGIIFHPEGTFYINPYNKNSTDLYLFYPLKDNFKGENAHRLKCEVLGGGHDILGFAESMNQNGVGSQSRSLDETLPLLTYRLAVAATGEYTNFHGGTVQSALSAIVTAINRVNSIYERDLGIRFLLVEDNDKIIFTDPTTDPYTNGNTGQMIGENFPVLRDSIGSNNFDIGHVFGTSSSLSGLAGVGNVCREDKARGVSTHVNPVNDPFIVAIVAHEMGHQFGARHTMYSCHNVNPTTAYEPGSGSTIMSYAGICAQGNNLESFPDPYYHANSLDVIIGFSRNGGGRACAVEIPTQNIPPQVDINLEDGFFIPKLTPFKLEGTATDPNPEDNLTYSWEQYDIGPSLDPFIPLGQSIGNSPLFRAWPPVEESYRYFPRLSDLVNNNKRPFELLPDTTRQLTFRMVVRDNNVESGATVWEQIRFNSTDNAGPFRVLFPNERDTFSAGEYIEVQWDVANTDRSPVNCQRVDVVLSEDGGFSYPHVLLADAPNSGSAFVNIPNLKGTDNRIKVRAADNIFFDISNTDFHIEEPTKAGVIVAFQPYLGRLCLPENLVVDFDSEALLGFSDTLKFEIVSELPDEAVVVQTPNNLIPGESGRLEIDLSETYSNGNFELDFIFYADSIDTLYRSVFYETVSNDYRQFDLISPGDGASGLDETTTFQWIDVADALGYNIQIASNPAFSPGDIVFEGTATEIDTISPDVQLATNTVYYWRARPFNVCGFGDFSKIAAFQTRTRDCETYQADDLPITIVGGSTMAFDSEIELTSSGQVSEIAIPRVRGSQPLVGDITITLISPSGTAVDLVRRKCGNRSNYDLGFDDNSPLEIECPLDRGLRYQPEEPLSQLSGEPLSGKWTMRIKKEIAGGANGFFQEWSMEVCSETSLSNLVIIRNDTLPVRPLERSKINRDFLRVDETGKNPEQLIYTITKGPENGTLVFFDQNISDPIGMTFSQKDINDQGLIYRADVDQETIDSFTFTVIDGEGGWQGTEVFYIKISDGPGTNVYDPESDNQNLLVFPNPGRGIFNYAIPSWVGQEVFVTVVSNSGQILKRDKVQLQSENQLNLERFPNGLYHIGITGANGHLSEKLILER